MDGMPIVGIFTFALQMARELQDYHHKKYYNTKEKGQRYYYRLRIR